MRKIISRAPARTCLFGDHQDYLKLPVIACAIDRHITLTAVTNGKDVFRLDLPDIKAKREIPIYPVTKPIGKDDHYLSVLKVLARHGCTPGEGYDVSITGNIAINAGTSSSTALVIAWVRFLLEAFGSTEPITPEFVSRVAYQAEVEEHVGPGGRMDQYSIGLGNVLYLETNDTAKYEIFDGPLEGLIVGESGIPKETTLVLAEMRGNAIRAIELVASKTPEFNLAEVRPSDLKRYLPHLPGELRVYLEAAVLNHDITRQARLEFLKESWDMPEIGRLMNDHHAILKDFLKLTVPRIDSMIEGALEAGALGAKIVGSGRGGCIIALAAPGTEQRVISAIKNAGARDAYSVNVDPGARILSRPG